MQVKLQIQDDSGTTKVVPLTRDEITVGRKEGNTIRLTDRNVSRTHARLIKRGDDVMIEDLSRYGTRVNGARINESKRLESGDVVQIGDYMLSLEGGAKQAAAAAESKAKAAPAAEVAAVDDKTEMQLAETQAVHKVSGDRESRGRGKKRISPNVPTLLAISSQLAGSDYSLDGETMIIGRTGDNDVRIDHHSISRNHAKVVIADGKTKMVDLGSKNGLRINGEFWEEADLKDGDIIELGKVKFRYIAPGVEFVFRPEDYDLESGALNDDESVKKSGKGWIVALLALLAAGLAAAYFLYFKADSDVSNVKKTAGASSTTTGSTSTGVAVKPATTNDNTNVVAAKTTPSPAVTAKAAEGDSDAAMAEVKALVAQQKWDEASAKLKSIDGADTNAEATSLLAMIASEKGIQAAYDKAVESQGKNDLQGAWNALGSIQGLTPKSTYYPRVNEMRSAIAPAIASKLVEQSTAAKSSGDFAMAIAKANEALKLVPGDTGATAALSSANAAKAATERVQNAVIPSTPAPTVIPVAPSTPVATTTSTPTARKKPTRRRRTTTTAKKPKTPKPAATASVSGKELYSQARKLHNSKPSEALALYTKAASKGYKKAYKQIGSLQLKRNNKSAAIKAYKRYVSLNPGARDAQTIKDIIVRLGGTP